MALTNVKVRTRRYVFAGSPPLAKILALTLSCRYQGRIQDTVLFMANAIIITSIFLIVSKALLKKQVYRSIS